MAIHQILFIAFLTSSLLGDVTSLISTLENDPSAFIEGQVNALTGRPALYEEDLVIQGVEPIRITRTYIDQEKGDWRFGVDFGQISETDKAYRLMIWEKDRVPILYKEAEKVKINGAKYIRYVPSSLEKGFSNTGRGRISSRTNLKNNYIFVHKNRENFIVHSAEGTIRTYQKLEGRNENYKLVSEHLSNGNWILYDYKEVKIKKDEKKTLLQSIRSTDPSQQKTYATATFVYQDGKSSNRHFSIIGSDGQQVEYSFETNELGNQAGPLKSVVSSSAPDQNFGYTKYRNKYEQLKGSYAGPEEYRIQTLSFPLDRRTSIDYYRRENEEVNGKQVHLDLDDWRGQRQMINDPRRDCVKTFSAPIGKDAALKTTHSFFYEPTYNTPYFKKISVYDIEGGRIDYTSDWYFRLEKLEQYSKEDQRINAQRFQWGYGESEGCLTTKTHLDGDLKPVFFTRYEYDHRGNIKYEKFCGNLSGKSSISIPLDQNGHPIDKDVETHLKQYTYSYGDPNLLIEEKHDSGLRIVYTYLPDTDLLSSKLIYDKNSLQQRHIFKYNVDRILICEIEDDGSSPDPDNLSDVTVRLIRIITPYETGPFIGMPKIIEEKYLKKDQEILLRKTEIRYGTGAVIEQKDIYDANNNLRFSLKMTYDAKGRLASESNALSQTALYKYDEVGNLSYTRDFSERLETFYTYDFSNRLTQKEEKGSDGIHRISLYDYDTKHNLISETDPYNNTTTYTPDSLGRREKITLPAILNEKGETLNSTTTFKYDSAGNPIEKKDPAGHITRTTYTAYGKPSQILHPDGAKEEFSYYLNGNLKTYTDPRGVVTSYLYDYQGRIIEKQTLNALETFTYKGPYLVEKTDPEHNKTLYEYDLAGRKISEEFGGEKTLFTYDELGRLCATQKQDLLTITEYDLLDRIIEERNESTSGDLFKKVQYEYDLAGNRSTIIHFINGKTEKELFKYDSINRLIWHQDALGFEEIYAYDPNTNRKTHTDPNGLQTIETFNAQNQLSSTENRKKDQTLALEQKYYNENGKLALQIDTIYSPSGSQRQSHTRWIYNSRGLLEQLIEAEGTLEAKTTHYTYTPRGELHTITKPNGVILTYQYNDLGHLESLTSSDHTVNYEMKYNLLGHLQKSNDISRRTDPHGRLLSETILGKYIIKNAYDPQGRRKTCEIPIADCHISYEYDPLYLRNVTRKKLDHTPLYTHSYTSYDLSGNLLQQQLINNIGTAQYTIDALSRTTSITAPQFSQTILDFDPVGNIRKMSFESEELIYTYDDLYQLTSETGFLSHTYTYDSLYNRLEKDSQKYEVNTLHQLSSHFKYDLNGNPIHHKITTYTYDALDRLIRIDTPYFSQTFTYDFLHRCLSKTITNTGPPQTRYFLYDDQNEIGSFDEQPIELRILGATPHAEIGASIAIELKGQIYVPIHDLQGNTALLIPLDHTPSTQYRYSAFGEENIKGIAPNPWRFSSKRVDSTTGLVNFGRRYYYPFFGRWLTPDPSGFSDGMNLYAFVGNAPLTHLDEYGLISLARDFNTAQQFTSTPWTTTNPYPAISDSVKHIAASFTHSLYDRLLAPLQYDQSFKWFNSSFSPQQTISSHKQSIDSFFGTNLSFRSQQHSLLEVGIPFGPGNPLVALKTASVSQKLLRNVTSFNPTKKLAIKAMEYKNPYSIKFTQFSVSQNFNSNGTINDLISGLRSGQIKVTDIPTIRVVEYEGKLFTLDNRRLVAFQNAGLQSIPIEKVSLGRSEILKEFRNKYRPINGGRNIVVLDSSERKNIERDLLRSYGKIE